MSFKQSCKNSLAADDGSALIEFAVSALLLFMVMFGLMEIARALYIDNFVSNAAPEALRYAAVRGSTWNGASCTSTQTNECMATATNVTSYLAGIAPQGVSTSVNYLTVATTWPGTTPSGAACSTSGLTNAPGCVVQVKVQYSFSFLFSFMSKQPFSLSSTSATVILQ
jgi:Flp pilus assembly protein TadG